MSTNTINIVSAIQTGEHQIRLKFDDQTEQTVDFGPFLKRSRHPDIRAYLQPERFGSFKIIYGELVWGDYDLNFPQIDLYRNNIEHAANQAQAA
jgi:hypothetical protein